MAAAASEEAVSRLAIERQAKPAVAIRFLSLVCVMAENYRTGGEARQGSGARSDVNEVQYAHGALCLWVSESVFRG